MPDATLAAKFSLIFASLLQTGLYASAIYLSFYLVKKIDFKNHFVPLTPLVGIIVVLILTPFVFSPLNFIFGKIFNPLLSPGRGLLEPLEGLLFLGLLWYIYKSLSQGR